MSKIVLDTNVLISAILFGGKPRVILEEIIEGKHELGLSKNIIDEMTAVLESKKFKFEAQVVYSIQSELIALATLVDPTISLKVIQDDPDDNKILECGLTFKANYIISGDMHLLKLKNYKKIQIITPAEFLGIKKENH